MLMIPKYTWHFTPGTCISVLMLTDCLACVKKWMDGDRLKLNPEKTIISNRQARDRLKLYPEKTIISNRQSRESPKQIIPTHLLGNSIPPTNEVYNLGITFEA